jgi:hypothetical protein
MYTDLIITGTLSGSGMVLGSFQGCSEADPQCSEPTAFCTVGPFRRGCQIHGIVSPLIMIYPTLRWYLLNSDVLLVPLHAYVRSGSGAHCKAPSQGSFFLWNRLSLV